MAFQAGISIQHKSGLLDAQELDHVHVAHPEIIADVDKGVRAGHNWPPAEPEQNGHPEPEKNRQPGRMNMADIPAGMVSGGPLLRSGRLLPRPCCILARATVGTASTESVSQLRPRKLGLPMAKTDALSKILPGAHSSAPSPVKSSFHPPTSVLEASLEPMKSIYRMLDDAEEDPRVFSCSYHIGYIRHDDDKLGAAVVVVPNRPADRDYCEEVVDKISSYAWR